MRPAAALFNQIPPINVFNTITGLRQWRAKAFQAGQSVGLVPTMGALHQGHINLVQKSLKENDHTVISIFVNPAQFAPHEDFSSYPRTVESDIIMLSKLESNSQPLPHLTVGSSSSSSMSSSSRDKPRKISGIFIPPVEAMYPSGIVHDVNKQIGAFVEVKGFSHQMEGRTRPTFFRGVATVVLKLFNLVQPTRAYFGQKDIQQGVIIRKMLTDFHLTYPSADNCFLVPTSREEDTALALSSRNVHLLENEKPFANSLYKALCAGRDTYNNDKTTTTLSQLYSQILDAAHQSIQNSITEASKAGVEIKLDFIGLNDAQTLNDLGGDISVANGYADHENIDKGAILSGAMWIGEKKTRLIDNVLLGAANSLTG